MNPIRTGELVNVDAGGPKLDGIVFDTPSRSKVIVAVVAAGRGPVMRTVHPDTLTVRTAEGSSDPALRLLMRRAPAPVHGVAGAAHGRCVHTRAPAHRTTGG